MRSVIVKRASRALSSCGVSLDASDRDDAVRAVLDAIREPTNEMVTAAAGLTEGEGGPIETWQAMIDAALANE